MKTVILTSRLGYGHTRAGEAIAAALRARRPEARVEIVDFWSLMAPRVSSAVKEAYLELVSRSPAAYEELYQLSEGDWQEFFRSGRLPPPLDRLAAKVVRDRFPEARGRLGLGRGVTLDETLFVALLRRFLAERKRAPGRVLGWGLALGLRSLLMARLLNRLEQLAPGAVVATQMMPATLLSYVRDNGELVDVPSFGVLTDYGVHDFWARCGLDCLCVAHADLAAELERKLTGGSRVEVTGMPLMPEFGRPAAPAEARRALGLAADKPTILVTGGAYAIGVAETLEELLAAHPEWQIVATGGGRPPAGELARLGERHRGRLLLLDWCRDMVPIVSAADLVVGKPGGLTISEAMALGKPFLAVRSLAGQESHNARFLERHGIGIHMEAGGLVETLRQTFADPEGLALMQRRALRAGRCDGAARIAALIEEAQVENGASPRWAVP